MREEGENRFVFICNRDRSLAIDTTIQLKGTWDIIKMDTLSGEESGINTHSSRAGWTIFPYRFEGCASLLLRLSPSYNSTRYGLSCLTPTEKPTVVSDIHLKGNSIISVPLLTILDTIYTDQNLKGVRLSEPNVLVLDYAEFKLDDDATWTSQEEVLRLDNIVRRRLGLFEKGQQIKQPWVFSKEERKSIARLTLRFFIQSDFTIPESCKLALENADETTIHINDVLIPVPKTASTEDWWVDRDIKTVTIPPYLIHKGSNTVTLSFDFGALTNVERIYLLGAFSVKLEGHTTTLQSLKANPITWGDIVPQGFPFYVGNLIYDVDITIPPATETTKSDVALSVPKFSSPVVAVTDAKSEQKLGLIAFQPHTLNLGNLKKGAHTLAITAYGNRFNSFGHFHAPEGVSRANW